MTREEKLEQAVRLVLALDDAPLPKVQLSPGSLTGPVEVNLMPKTREQLEAALRPQGEARINVGTGVVLGSEGSSRMLPDSFYDDGK